MIVPAARHAVRNSDCEYAYRQDSDFFYLTGFTEPEAVLVIAGGRNPRDVLFLRPHDRKKELWTGKRLGVESAVTQLDIDAAHEIGKLDEQLADFFVGSRNLYYELGINEEFDRRVHSAVREAHHRTRRGGVAPTTFISPTTVISEMRLHKSQSELETMRRAAAITKAGHEAGMRSTRPGIREYELKAGIEHEYRVRGAHDVAYLSIVASGDNALVLHYVDNSDELRDGQLVLVDSGCEVDSYASDVTRTWPVNGKFSTEQRAIYELVLAAQKAAIDCVRPGLSFNAAHERATRVLAAGLIELGLLKGSIEEAIESKSIEAFYPHRTGHWLGLDVHDVGSYLNDGEGYRILEPGMVVTVEPGLYIQRDLDVDERFKGIGVRIEDDIHCTDGDPEILTIDIPKQVAELEAIVGSAVGNTVR
jgi:Xaa-Pro aminopeptidase